MPRLPDFRFTEVDAAVKGGTTTFDDVLCQALADCLQELEADANVVYAFELYQEPRHRQALDAFSLALAPPAVIQEVTEIPVAVIKVYQYLFMDTGVFRNRLERFSFAADYATIYGCEEHVGERMRTAVTAGVDYLRWVYASPNPDANPKQIIRDSMLDSFYRSMVHKGNSLISGVSKEAVKWMQTSVKFARMLEDIDPQTAKAGAEQLVITLKAPDMKYSAPAEAVSPADILH